MIFRLYSFIKMNVKLVSRKQMIGYRFRPTEIFLASNGLSISSIQRLIEQSSVGPALPRFSAVTVANGVFAKRANGRYTSANYFLINCGQVCAPTKIYRRGKLNESRREAIRRYHQAPAIFYTVAAE